VAAPGGEESRAGDGTGWQGERAGDGTKRRGAEESRSGGGTRRRGDRAGGVGSRNAMALGGGVLSNWEQERWSLDDFTVTLMGCEHGSVFHKLQPSNKKPGPPATSPINRDYATPNRVTKRPGVQIDTTSRVEETDQTG
jgi:hypothetical protein